MSTPSSRDLLERRERERVAGGLVPGIAHELNNALTSLGGWAELLNACSPERLADLRTHLQDILMEARRCDGLVRGLAGFVRAPRDGQARREPVANAVDAAMSLLAYQLKSADVTVDLSIADDLPMPDADRSSLQLVIIALLHNAMEAVSGCEGRRIRLSAESCTGGIRLTVEDGGPGVAAEVARAALEPALPERAFGSEDGLGLAGCAHVLASIGGALAIEGGDGGTRVVAHIPG